MSAATLLASLAQAQRPAAATTVLFRNQLVHAGAGGGRHDFDFLFGRWRVANERLRDRLAGSTEWQRFDAILDCRPILGGVGNVDEFVTDELDADVFVGATLRLYDRARQRWSLYWASNRTGVLEPPVVGSFADGVGRFEGDDVHAGRPVRVRFVWSGIGADRAQWEQAFSPDGGRSWETNWRMRLSRLADYDAAARAAPA